MSKSLYIDEYNIHRTQLVSALAPEAAYVSTNWGEPAFLGNFLDFQREREREGGPLVLV